VNYINSINRTLFNFLKLDKNNIILGEDILDPYGGAFKATKGLSSSFPNQVISTPISEATITGVGTGLALNGHSVIVEIMFGDFITLCTDQIVNGVSKFLDYNKKKFGTFIIRAPMGGYRGYGATHSQSLETLLFNIPNVSIFSPNIFSNPGNLLEKILDSEKFAMLIEHKVSYPKSIEVNKKNNFDLIIQDNDFYTKIEIINKKPDFSILTYGYMTEIALESVQDIFLKHELIGEVISLKKIKPFETKLVNLINSDTIFTLEEGIEHAGWGRYISSYIYPKIISKLKKEIIHIGSKNSLIPASIEQEKLHLPSKSNTIEVILKNLNN